MKCIKCNGDMIGDAYTSPLHCEYTDAPDGAEADSGPWYCAFEEDSPQDKQINQIKKALQQACEGKLVDTPTIRLSRPIEYVEIEGTIKL